MSYLRADDSNSTVRIRMRIKYQILIVEDADESIMWLYMLLVNFTMIIRT